MSRKSTKKTKSVNENINDIIPEETNVINDKQSVDETTNDTANKDTSDIVSEDQIINNDESINQQPSPIQPTNFRKIINIFCKFKVSSFEM